MNFQISCDRMCKKLSTILFQRYQLCVSWQQVFPMSFPVKCAHNNSALVCLFVLLDRLRSNHTLPEYNTVIKRDTLCNVSSVLSRNLCLYLSRCPYLSQDVYTKAWGDVLISSRQDEFMMQRKHLIAWIAFGWPGNPFLHICACVGVNAITKLMS